LKQVRRKLFQNPIPVSGTTIVFKI